VAGEQLVMAPGNHRRAAAGRAGRSWYRENPLAGRPGTANHEPAWS
jgi:hypothetical protein